MKKELSKTSANKNIQNFEAQFKKSTILSAKHWNSAITYIKCHYYIIF